MEEAVDKVKKEVEEAAKAAKENHAANVKQILETAAKQKKEMDKAAIIVK